MFLRIRRRWWLSAAIALGAVAIAAVAFLRQSVWAPPMLYLSAVGPMSGPNKAAGMEMVNGIRLYINQQNARGGVNKRKIGLRIFNDQSVKQTATKVAVDVGTDGSTLLVLGHYESSTSLAAGDVYKKYGIPAITASATADELTRNGGWYFRIVPNNTTIASMLANYLKSLGHTSASVIFDQDDYGKSLAVTFQEMAEDLGITINRTWSFSTDTAGLDSQLEQITTELRSVNNLGSLFLATQSGEGVRILTALNFPGANYSIFGADSFTGQLFLEKLQENPIERAQPGYYSNNVRALSPVLLDIGNANTFAFYQAYQRAYKMPPSWVAATYYDAAQMAVAAIERAEVSGNGDIQDERRNIKDALQSFDSPIKAIHGVSGELYFNDKHEINRPMDVGVWQKQLFIPEFAQYRVKPELPTTEGASASEEAHMRLNDIPLTKTDIVYVGIDVNEIRNLDIATAQYDMDFYIWFRFQGTFDEQEIEFINAVDPIRFGEPIFNKANALEPTIRAYHLTGTFRTEFDRRLYPFERQHLVIRMRHRALTNTQLIFVPDRLGATPPTYLATIGTTLLDVMTGWGVETIETYQTIFIPNAPALQVPYSQFNVAVVSKRIGMTFIIKTFFPILALLALIYCTYYVPYDRCAPQFGILSAVALVAVGYHLRLLWSLKSSSFLVINQVFWAMYLLSVLTMACIGWFYWRQQQEKPFSLRVATYLPRLFYPLFLVIFGGWILYQYQVLP